MLIARFKFIMGQSASLGSVGQNESNVCGTAVGIAQHIVVQQITVVRSARSENIVAEIEMCRLFVNHAHGGAVTVQRHHGKQLYARKILTHILYTSDGTGSLGTHYLPTLI